MEKNTETFDYECDFILRKPTNEEQLVARIDTSDYQISGLTIQSSILFNFGFCSRTYRSKTATVQKSNRKKASRYRQILQKLLSYYKSDDPVEKLYNDMGETVTNLDEKYGVDLESLFHEIATWREAARQDILLPQVAREVKSRYAKPPRIRFNFEEDSVEEEPVQYEPSEREVAECKELYKTMLAFVAERSKGGLSLRKWMKKAILMDSFISIMDDTLLSPVRDEILSWEGTIGELEKFMLGFLDREARQTVRAHARTVMESECRERQREVAEILFRDNIPFDFDGFKYYMENYASTTCNSLRETYGLEFDTLYSFEDMARFFYEPERMHRIRRDLKVKVRARSKCGERMGNKWAVKSFNYEGRIQKLKEFVGDYDEAESGRRIAELAKRVAEREAENEEAKRVRKLAKQRYDAAVERSAPPGEVESRRREYEEVVQAAVGVSKSLSSARAALKNAREDAERKGSAIERIREYREKYALVLEAAREASMSSDAVGLEHLEREFRLKAAAGDNIPYSTWSFKMDGMREEAIRAVVGELERGFCGDCGEENPNYVNVTAHAYLDRTGREFSEFFVDYPKNGKVYKAFAGNRKLSETLIGALSRTVGEKLGYTVKFDCEGASVNEDLETSLAGPDGTVSGDAWDALERALGN